MLQKLSQPIALIETQPKFKSGLKKYKFSKTTPFLSHYKHTKTRDFENDNNTSVHSVCLREFSLKASANKGDVGGEVGQCQEREFSFLSAWCMKLFFGLVVLA